MNIIESGIDYRDHSAFARVFRVIVYHAVIIEKEIFSIFSEIKIFAPFPINRLNFRNRICLRNAYTYYIIKIVEDIEITESYFNCNCIQKSSVIIAYAVVYSALTELLKRRFLRTYKSVMQLTSACTGRPRAEFNTLSAFKITRGNRTIINNDKSFNNIVIRICNRGIYVLLDVFHKFTGGQFTLFKIESNASAFLRLFFRSTCAHCPQQH